MSDNAREFDQNSEIIARFFSNFQREADHKCYYPCKSCNNLKTRRIKIKITKRHFRENGHIEEGFYYYPFVSCLLYCLHN